MGCTMYRRVLHGYLIFYYNLWKSKNLWFQFIEFGLSDFLLKPPEIKEPLVSVFRFFFIESMNFHFSSF
jgi:hypothetical protein